MGQDAVYLVSPSCDIYSFTEMRCFVNHTDLTDVITS